MKFIVQSLKNIKLLTHVFQLLEQYKEGEVGAFDYKSISKAHANMLKKIFLAIFLEELAFVIKRAGWKFTKIHTHLTFE